MSYLPKKLKPEFGSSKFILNEKDRTIMSVFDGYTNTGFREAVIKRYNSYTPLVIALTLVSTALVFTLIALI